MPLGVRRDGEVARVIALQRPGKRRGRVHVRCRVGLDDHGGLRVFVDGKCCESPRIGRDHGRFVDVREIDRYVDGGVDGGGVGVARGVLAIVDVYGDAVGVLGGFEIVGNAGPGLDLAGGGVEVKGVCVRAGQRVDQRVVVVVAIAGRRAQHRRRSPPLRCSPARCGWPSRLLNSGSELLASNLGARHSGGGLARTLRVCVGRGGLQVACPRLSATDV